ncbi:Mitochondrial carrier domain [Pseudocohnilembus persalinus]|uniref:Mitochondrial carrier domain n=1 Tax=Pseudocohnilembus persalinus TaxID=266149 RepID=A0A0V0R7T1_PSEPJ|nr:Mitochondrial carrier domain [Pseudocohnilembus persalinus]|eukprot:KRX10535.1 Mitochondrial carrier domain [Pseudocohnilembus persalinus]
MDNLKASLTASIASVVLFTPLDTLRIQMSLQQQKITIKQLAKNIFQQEGLKGLYRGLGISLMTQPISTSFYLTLYESIKNNLNQHTFFANSNNNYAQQAIASITTGAIVNTFTNPLWLIKTKIQGKNLKNTENLSQQIQQYKYRNQNQNQKLNNQCQNESVLKKEIKQIYLNNGIKGYFKGLGISQLGLIHVGLYYSIYESLKNKVEAHRKQNDEKLNASDIFLASSVAKGVSIYFTYPTQFIATRLQVLEQQQPLLQQMKQIYKQEGIKGFFKGIKIEVLRSIPANALTFMIYEKIRLNRGKLF